MPEEGEQGLPRELAVDGEAEAEASESSLWSEWVLLQEGNRAEIRGCSHTETAPEAAGHHLPAQGMRDVGSCPVPLAPGIYLPRT